MTMRDEVVVSTPWFRLLARYLDDAGPQVLPHYCIDTCDYVSIVALDEQGRLVLVKQYRPAVQQITLELPGGHVDPGQEPVDAARQELWEETGYHAREWQLLGRLRPDVGRLTNNLWVFWAESLFRNVPDDWKPESDVESVAMPPSIGNLLERGLDNTISLASLMLAVLKRKVPLD
jgi:ADP-ribose pyrophosphatase